MKKWIGPFYFLDYEISSRGDDKFWIQAPDGEGMEISKERVLKWLEFFFQVEM